MESINLGPPELITKAVIRQKVWEFLEKKDIANFPRPVYHRIPNFKGAATAAQLFSTLPEYQSARTVQVSALQNVFCSFAGAAARKRGRLSLERFFRIIEYSRVRPVTNSIKHFSV